jgi:UDP:flavonoid glycosyltransferase YjiC (YdhE family)
MRVLWAVSSVGKGHVVRDIAIAGRLQSLADVEIDWLAPYPADDFLRSRGYHVLECSSRLAGSGKAYEEVFARATDEFNLMDYIRVETKLHKPDFMISVEACEEKDYAVLVGDESFWLLSGFASRWAAKPAPFVFLTDFIGTKAMRLRPRDLFRAWSSNLGFTMSHMGPDVYVYIGAAEEIPDERFGFLLPSRRRWARKHCRFVKPIVGFDPGAVPDKGTLRQELQLPASGPLFLATVGPEGDHARRAAFIEEVLERLKDDFPDAYFMMVCPESGAREWIDYRRFLEGLHRYFAASDFVVAQSGYGKVAELSALGIPFLVIPLDHHFEQEHFMAHRLDHYGIGKLVTLRDHDPQAIATMARRLMEHPAVKIAVDDGREVAELILEAARKDQLFMRGHAE